MRISQENMYLWDEAAKEVPTSDLLPARDYAGLNGQSEQLRVWLPEAASIGLVAAAKRAKTTITAYLNEYFATYLYGYYELLRMRDMRIGLYEPKEATKGVRSCAMYASDQPPKLGKNLYAVKIFVSKRLKNDLERRAELLQVSLGEFARALISQHLFGREYGLPDSEIEFSDRSLAEAWEISEEEDAGDSDVEF